MPEKSAIPVGICFEDGEYLGQNCECANCPRVLIENQNGCLAHCDGPVHGCEQPGPETCSFPESEYCDQPCECAACFDHPNCPHDCHCDLDDKGKVINCQGPVQGCDPTKKTGKS